MGSRTTGRHRWWIGGCSLLWMVAAGVGQGRTRSAEKLVVRPEAEAFARAETARAELDAISEGDRTKAAYDRVLDRYRAVYHRAPQDVHAAEAVYAVAELLTEEGRAQRDAGLLRAAVGQYEFLRKQYPGSSWRVPAMLHEGTVEAGDLGQITAGRELWAELVRAYPGSAAAAAARLRLAENLPISGQDGENRGSSASPRSAQEDQSGGGAADRMDARDSAAGLTDSGKGQTDRQRTPATLTPSGEVVVESSAAPVFRSNGMRAAAGLRNAGSGSGRTAAVTGIRHWSTASYTRVAIDLGDEVAYQAVRVTGPDRIYFDLHGTRLAAELVGKSFAVTDDGFLKRIRAAQFSDDMTRVVLDVNEVTEYSAFLLPNPYRLIIDIHGAKPRPDLGTEGGGTPGALPASPVPDPATARVVTPTVARPVPNTVTLPATRTTAEVAKVSEQPGRMEATVTPTSSPVAQVVRSADGGGVRAMATAGRGMGGGGRGAVAGADGEGTSTVATPAAAGKKGRKSRAKLADGGVVAVTEAVAAAPAMGVPGVPARAALPTADGQTSLVRALGLKVGRIVIDAGHGGHDSGTLGVDGIEEKDVVLDVALRLGRLLHDRLGAEVIYTRSDDTFVPLETRTAIANKAQADLFLSIHANSSSDATARGVETYYLNFTTDPTALNVAARENAVSDHSVGQLSDLVKKIALKDKIAESREFAADVEGSLYSGLEQGNAGLRDRGVKKAPFVVLIGANMPSVLAEISFVTNARDARELRQPGYRERVAESLYRGVAKYEGGLSGERAGPEKVAQMGLQSGR